MKNVFLIFLFVSKISFACQCPLTALNLEEANKYDIIFKGKISSIKINKELSEALFTINELYKGVVAENFKIIFNDLDVCKIEMRAGDEWIIYANYNQVSSAKLDFCSRSRKFFKSVKEDFFAVTTGNSYSEEVVYLQKNLGLHKIQKETQIKVEQRNIIPSSKQFVLMLLLSIVGIVFFYWLVNKYLK